MTDNDDFKALRRYEPWEVVKMLNLKKTWLKRWVTEEEVPHQRSGQERGVWFTYADIMSIGELLPKLMTGTQANRRAESQATGPGEDRSTDLAAASVAEISEDDRAAFRDLRSISSRLTSRALEPGNDARAVSQHTNAPREL